MSKVKKKLQQNTSKGYIGISHLSADRSNQNEAKVFMTRLYEQEFHVEDNFVDE